MAKLKTLSRHKVENIPDYILEEIKAASMTLFFQMVSVVDSMSPNIALNAIQWANASFIRHLVTNDPEELRKAANWAAIELIKNVETLIKQMEKKNKDNQ